MSQIPAGIGIRVGVGVGPVGVRAGIRFAVVVVGWRLGLGVKIFNLHKIFFKI